MTPIRFLKQHYRRIILFLFDVLCFISLDVIFLVVNRVRGNSAYDSLRNYVINSLFLLILIFSIRNVFGIYRIIWRYTSTNANFFLVLSDCIAGVLAWFASYLMKTYQDIWFFVTVASLTALLTLMARFTYRMIYKHQKRNNDVNNAEPIAIVGAGHAGVSLATALLQSNSSLFQPMFFIDIDENKIGNKVVGLTVYRESDAPLLLAQNQIKTVVFAFRSKEKQDMEQLFAFYHRLNCQIKIYDYRSSTRPKTATNKPLVREFGIEDLLMRKPIQVEGNHEFDFYRDKVILITGGGGSIGSEICRQVARCHPKQLIVFDIYENNAYDIQQELVRKYGNALDFRVEIGSVRDFERLDSLFAFYKPQIVFHAAAHKHVPLMEQSGCEAIKNNVFGTYNTANVAEKYGVEKFILISTDKAVNPTNIMGASKRLCEMVIQCRTDSKTSFSAVRFGNVLGSNGSVIPLFKRQIAEGGPVTVTDKRIIRYFMTIPEASQLVMLAGAMAGKGELFVLDMGKPVRIYDLAVNMIQLSGLVPDKDIKIEEIGLRPGEKLYEELLMKSESLKKTDNEMIFVEQDSAKSREEMESVLTDLKAILQITDLPKMKESVKEAIKRNVPTFHEPIEINQNAEKSDEMKLSKEK